jgi:AraC-like DNA-binding protein
MKLKPQASPRSSMVVTAREMIARRLAGGRPEIRAVARTLNISVRTLQRRLAERGWTYQRLLDEARFAEARRAIAKPDDLLKVLASDLGFEEQASFTRAFRRWTGLSPSEYRRRLGPAARDRLTRRIEAEGVPQAV